MKLALLGLFAVGCQAQNWISQITNKPFVDVRSYAHVASFTGGIQEAITAAVSNGQKSVYVAPGTYSLTKAIQLPTQVTLFGAGDTSIIKVANSSIAGNANWQLPTQTIYCVICLAASGDRQRVGNLLIDGNGANQIWLYYGEISAFNATNAIIEQVTLKNHTIVGGTGVFIQFLGHSPKSANSNNVIINTSTIGISGCTVPNGGGAYYIEGYGNRVISSATKNSCDSTYVISECDHCGVYDSIADVGTGQMSTPTFSIEGATNTTFSGIKCLKSGSNGHFSCVGVQSTDTTPTTNTTVSNMSVNACNLGVSIGTQFGAHTAQVKDTLISSTTIDTCSTGVFVSLRARKVTLDNLHILSSTAQGLWVSSNAANVVENISLVNSTIDHSGGVSTGAIFIENDASPGSAPVRNLVVTNSFLGDSAGSPVQKYGIVIHAGLVSGAVVTNNLMTGNVTGAVLYQNTWDKGAILGPNVTSTTVDPDYGTYTITGWATGNARGRLQALYSSADASNHDYIYLSDNFRHNDGNASTGTIDTASNGTAEVAVRGSQALSGRVVLRAGAVNTAPSDILIATSAGVALLPHVNQFTLNSDFAGAVLLSAGTFVKTFATAYLAAPICVATDTTANNSVKVATTTTTATFTGTGTDIIAYVCVGNPN